MPMPATSGILSGGTPISAGALQVFVSTANVIERITDAQGNEVPFVVVNAPAELFGTEEDGRSSSRAVVQSLDDADAADEADAADDASSALSRGGSDAQMGDNVAAVDIGGSASSEGAIVWGRFKCRACGGRKLQAAHACRRPCPKEPAMQQPLETIAASATHDVDGIMLPPSAVVVDDAVQPSLHGEPLPDESQVTGYDHGCASIDEEAARHPTSTTLPAAELIGRFKCSRCGGRKRAARAACFNPCPRSRDLDDSHTAIQSIGAVPFVGAPDLRCSDVVATDATDTSPTSSLVAAGASSSQLPEPQCAQAAPSSTSASSPPVVNATALNMASDASMDLPLVHVGIRQEWALHSMNGGADAAGACEISAPAAGPLAEPPMDHGSSAVHLPGGPASSEVGRYNCRKCGGRKMGKRQTCLAPCPGGSTVTIEAGDADEGAEWRDPRLALAQAAGGQVPLSLTRPLRLNAIGLSEAFRKPIPIDARHQCDRLPAYLGPAPAIGGGETCEPQPVSSRDAEREHAVDIAWRLTCCAYEDEDMLDAAASGQEFRAAPGAHRTALLWGNPGSLSSRDHIEDALTWRDVQAFTAAARHRGTHHRGVCRNTPSERHSSKQELKRRRDLPRGEQLVSCVVELATEVSCSSVDNTASSPQDFKYKCRICGGRKRAKVHPCAGPCWQPAEAQLDMAALSDHAMPGEPDYTYATSLIVPMHPNDDNCADLATFPYKCRTCGGRKRAKRHSCAAPCAGGQAEVAQPSSSGEHAANRAHVPSPPQLGTSVTIEEDEAGDAFGGMPFKCHTCGGRKRAKRHACQCPCPGGDLSRP